MCNTEQSYVGRGNSATTHPQVVNSDPTIPPKQVTEPISKGYPVRYIELPKDAHLWFTYQDEVSQLEELTETIASIPGLSLYVEAVYNSTGSIIAYKEQLTELPVEVIHTRIWAIRFVSLFLEQLISTNSLLVPAGKEITTKDNLFDLIESPNGVVAGQHLPIAPVQSGKQLTIPGTRVSALMPNPATSTSTPASLRQLIHRRIVEYGGCHGATTQQTYNYLYKRLFEVYDINVYRLTKAVNESLLDALERYGHLDRLYSLLMAELNFSEY